MHELVPPKKAERRAATLLQSLRYVISAHCIYSIINRSPGWLIVICLPAARQCHFTESNAGGPFMHDAPGVHAFAFHVLILLKHLLRGMVATFCAA